jgi:hypothetical protein
LKQSLLYQQIAVLLLSVAFLAQTFSKGFIIADYYANTAAYAKNCVNKARPAMHCNGKCQVMKKMQEEEKKEQESAARFGSFKLEVLSTKSFFASLPHYEGSIIESVKITNNSSHKPIHRSYNFFHPPQV